MVSVFANTSTGDTPLTYLWDFGDSITSTLESPTHIYEMTGTFTVTLTVENIYGMDVYTGTQTVESEIWEIFLPIIFKQGD
jgi:PKD repeat protein